MSVNEAQRALERIGADLEVAIEQLAQRPAALDQWPATLRNTSEALQKIRGRLPAAAQNKTLAPIVRTIQDRVKRVQALLESAALFYCGCVAVTTSHGAGYTHEGSLEQFVVAGRMQLEA